MTSPVDLEAAQGHYLAFLRALGSHPDEAEAREAARMASSLLAEWTSSCHSSGLPSVTPFAAPPKAEWVALQSLPFFAFCEHHMVPFFGTVDVVYLPRRNILGFGSVLRLLDHVSRRPQLQERLTQQFADAIEEVIEPEGLLVRMSARQLCVEMRGRGTGTQFVCIATRGCVNDPSSLQLANTLCARTS